MTVGVTNQILSVPAYKVIYPQKSCFPLLHAHEILQPLLRLQESKAMRLRAWNEDRPRPTLLYISHNSSAYVQEVKHHFTGSLPKPLKGTDFRGSIGKQLQH